MMEGITVHAKLRSEEIPKVETVEEHMPSVSIQLPSCEELHSDWFEVEAAEQGLLCSASSDC
jgi:hypothetical protein